MDRLDGRHRPLRAVAPLECETAGPSRTGRIVRWWTQGDSNPQPPPCKGGTLPLSYGPISRSRSRGADGSIASPRFPGRDVRRHGRRPEVAEALPRQNTTGRHVTVASRLFAACLVRTPGQPSHRRKAPVQGPSLGSSWCGRASCASARSPVRSQGLMPGAQSWVLGWDLHRSPRCRTLTRDHSLDAVTSLRTIRLSRTWHVRFLSVLHL